jgi:hypothetical protein
MMIPSRNALENSVRIWNCSCERSGIIGGIEPIHTRTILSMIGGKLDW